MTQKKKSIKRTPVKKIERTPAKWPLLLSKKDPRDNIEDFKKVSRESEKRVRQEFLKSISREVGYIENLTDTNLEPTHLYDYQKRWINDRSKYRHCDKSRQIGQSYCFACEGYAKAQLLSIYTGLFISYNQDEANEKVVYARSLYESTPFKYKKKLVVDRVTALEFEGMVSGGRTTKTRLISHPQREPRGKGYNTDVFLDEIAHYQWPDKVYVAAVPIVTRGLGQLSMASSPLGKNGLHYIIGHDTETYNMFSRHKIYWWDNPEFLNDDALRNIVYVKKLAPTMQTLDRVLEFGNEAIIQAYHSMMEEDFMQEYEINPADSSVSYYPMDLVNQCTFEGLKGLARLEEEDEYGEHPIYQNPVYPGLELKTYDTPEALSHAIALGQTGKLFYAGFDVGREEDSSEIVIIEEMPMLNHLQIIRHMITMKRTEFKKQFEQVEKLFSMIPIKLLKIDSTGMGRNLAEDLIRRFHSRIEDIVFNNENKSSMATNIKLRMEDQSIAYPNDKDLIRQIHSIKRKITENNTVKYEAERSKLHHGDKFWALALASSAGEPAQMHSVRLITANIGRVTNATRIVKIPNQRMFRGLPNVVHDINWKGLPPPPKHLAEFSVNAVGMENLV